MKLLALTRYSRLGASSRLRTMQYIPALEAADIEVECIPFFDDAYLERLYSGQRTAHSLAGYFAARLRRLILHPKPDMVWLEKEVLPWVPWAIERAILPRGVPYICDIDDAVFHRYDKNGKRVVRCLLGDKIDNVMKYSTLVTAGNSYLAARAQSAGAQRVEIVPTVVDTDKYLKTPLPDPDGRLRIGWIGTPQTWAELAEPVFRTVAPVLARHDARFRAIGASLTARVDGTLEVVQWSETHEIDLIRGLDVGVMPLPDTPWTRGKCGYKLIQYMACGLPVIASPVGVNSQIVDHGVNGFLAESDADWRDAAERLLHDPQLRKSMGDAGRRKIEQEYALGHWGQNLARFLKDIHRGRDWYRV